MIYCDNLNCKHYDNQVCTANPVYVVNRNCVTSRRKPRDENYRGLMQASFKTNCSKNRSKWKSNNFEVLK